MKIECLKEKLEFGLGIVERIADRNPTLPILSCIYMEVEGSVLLLRTTNLDLGVEFEVPVKVRDMGVMAVPARVLGGFVNSLQNTKTIILEESDGNLLIKSEKGRALIKTFPAKDFPTIPKIDGGNSFIIPAKNLVSGLRSVSYGASLSNIKPELGSVYVYGDGGYLFFVATDSFRLAEKKIKTNIKQAIPNTLIPIKNVNEILRLLEGIHDDVKIQFDKSQFSINHQSFYLMSRVVDGNFPDYNQIIPKDFKTEAVVLKHDLMQIFKTSSIFSDSSNQVSFRLDPAKKVFEISSTNQSVGETVNFIEASIKGEAITINFNLKYIFDCLQSVEVDSLSLGFNGLHKPLIIRGVSDSSFTYLVMPMNK